MDTTSRENERIVRAVYDDFNTRNISGLAALFGDDCETVDMTTGERYRGFEGFMSWVKPFADAMPDSTATPVRYIVQGDWVATEHVGRGTHTGPLVTPSGTIPATNRAVELHFGEFFQIRDGKIVRFHAYWDLGSLLRQLS
jgi:steroid delta-isomerase-like uncharacterized protein